MAVLILPQVPFVVRISNNLNATFKAVAGEVEDDVAVGWDPLYHRNIKESKGIFEIRFQEKDSKGRSHG